MYSSVAFCFEIKKAPELCKLQVPQNLDPPVARTKSLGKGVDTLNANKASEPITEVHLSEIGIFREAERETATYSSCHVCDSMAWESHLTDPSQ